ncbi:hypothetical protein BDR03DRAFT_23266 [Suillus americanus]|nr:hypothetical protein BDR03DRAFT_23266 [Suillus americanus]
MTFSLALPRYLFLNRMYPSVLKLAHSLRALSIFLSFAFVSHLFPYRQSCIVDQASKFYPGPDWDSSIIQCSAGVST